MFSIQNKYFSSNAQLDSFGALLLELIVPTLSRVKLNQIVAAEKIIERLLNIIVQTFRKVHRR